MPPGRRPNPTAQGRVNKHAQKYPWIPAPGPWEGEVPKPPTGLRKAAKDTWEVWFTSWWSGHWTEADLPMLRLAIVLYDAISQNREQRGDRAELRQLAKALGITPDGRQALRWEPPSGQAEDDQGEDDELAQRREERKARLA